MLFFRQKKILLFLFLFLGFILLGYGLIAQNSLRISWVETTRRKFLLYEGPVIDLFQDKKLEQTFISNYPGLTQVDVLLEGSGTADGQNVMFHLKNSCNSVDDLIVISSELSGIEDLEFHSFTFPPLDNSAGQSYCIVLEAPEAVSENAVLLQLSTGDLYPFGELKIHAPEQLEDSGNSATSLSANNDNLPYKIYLPYIIRASETGVGRDIGFQLHYKGLLRPTAQVFITRLTANKPYIWGQVWFYGGLVIVYFILLVGLFYLARKTIQLDQK